MPPKRQRLTAPPKSHGAAAKKAKAELAKTMEEAHVKPPSPHSKSKRGLEGRKKVQPNTPKSELIARLQEGTEFTDGGVSSDVAAAQWTDMRVQSAAVGKTEKQSAAAPETAPATGPDSQALLAGGYRKGDRVRYILPGERKYVPWLSQNSKGIVSGPCDDSKMEGYAERLVIVFDANPDTPIACSHDQIVRADGGGGSSAGKQFSDGGGSAVAKQVSDGGGSSEEEEGEDSAQDKLRICPSAFECHSDDCDGLWRMPEKKDVRDAHDVRNGNKIQSKSSVYQARCGTCHAVFGPTPAEQKTSRKKKKKAMDAQGRAGHTRTANERDCWRVHYKLPPLLHGKKAATTEAETAEAATADASSEHARDAGDDEEDHASSDAEPSDLKEAKEGHAQHSDALKWTAKKNARWTAGN